MKLCLMWGAISLPHHLTKHKVRLEELDEMSRKSRSGD
jgi:hypothetical protein